MNKLFVIIVISVSIILWTNCKKNGADISIEAEKVVLKLPEGFEAVVVADSIGPARHLVVNGNGDIYVKLRRSYEDGTIVALRDTTGDGKADVIKKFGVIADKGNYHTGMKIYKGYLYFSTNLTVYRYKLKKDQLIPVLDLDTIMVDDHSHGSHEHIGKPLSFDGKGNMYVPFGAPSDACQEANRKPGSPGLDPCPQLKDHGGIWKFDANKKKQTQKDGFKIASGLRSVVAMDWNEADNHLYVVQHGRDDLDRTWPQYFSNWENALLPSEEFVRIQENSNFGWPYCFYDQIQGKKVLSPEYGGDGKKIGRCNNFDDPIVGFPGHYAPNDLQFYHADQFPEHYRNGAFIAFHGSTIREPYPQAGYFISFVPFKNGQPDGEWEVFANGFAGVDPIVNTGDAAHRPVGLAVGPEGALYITESVKGKIWRIQFVGDRESFDTSYLTEMANEKKIASNIRTPDKKKDIIGSENASAGEKVYSLYCSACHQLDGKGVTGRYPTLHNTKWVNGDKERLIEIILTGGEGAIEVNGEIYENDLMPAHDFLSNQEVADVITYIRQNFGNSASMVSADEVKKVRKNVSKK